MTQTTFAPPPVAEQGFEETAEGSRRTALVAAGAVVALALAAGGYFLVSGGSSEPTSSAAPVTRLPIGTKATTKVVKPAVVKPATQVPPTSSAPIGRDPFLALYVAPATSDAAPAVAGTTPTTTGSTTTSGSTTTQPAAPTLHKLILTKVSGGTATFTVDGKVMLAKVGSVFGPTAELKLLDLTDTSKGWVATLQVGDSEPVDALKGQTLYVR